MSDEPTLALTLTSSEHPTPRDRIEVTLGETIGRYQVRRLLGGGGMGHVYLTRDVVLGRSVALKIVGLGKGSEFRTERFLDEARAIARLNHPHVVQLYDFGEYKGGLYLALEYVEGDTLRDRARNSMLGIDEVLRHTRAIADGLSHAHAAGVYHCDLKPSNVMVGKDGRVRVVDFGIARTGENAANTHSGTPDWMAPEQWTGAPVTDRADSWALGVMTAQLLTGKHPLGDDIEQRREAVRDPSRIAAWKPDRHDVPAAVIELITRSFEREPTLRPSAAEWARLLDTVIVDGRSDAVVEDGPYRGLAPFDEKHARFYFGREREIDAFLERLRDSPQLPIVGPSGAGKSSFLHAGVIPRLRAREPWTVIAFRPGADPAGALARHVMLAVGDEQRVASRTGETQTKAQVQAFRAELLETPTLLAARLATIANMHGSHVLLAVDQLEEAFTQGASDAERQSFLQMLLSAVDDPLDPVRVVVTVRDDFVGKLAGLRSLFVVKKLGIDDVRRTITGPLARYDYQFDDVTIVDDLIAEVDTAEAANLPLLQFACRTLWDGRDVAQRRLLRATYREMGGLAGALARHADHALTELSPDELRTARQLLLQLVVGTTRRSVARDQLVSGASPDTDAVLDRLLSARLLVQRNQGDGEAPIIEIVHESLVETWSQLARWLDDSHEERRLLDDLQDAAKLWERRGRRIEDTWSEKDLSAARYRAEQLSLALPTLLQEFFTAGDQRHQAARRRRRTRNGIALAVAITVAALAATGVVVFIRNIAAERDRADAALVSAQRERDRAKLSEASLLLEKDPTKARDLLAQLTLRTPQYALLTSRARQLSAARLVPLAAGINGLFRAPDGATAELLTPGGDLYRLDPQSGVLETLDHDLTGAVTYRAGQWLYARKPFGPRSLRIATPSQPSLLDAGALTSVSRLVTLNDAVYALDSSGDLYRLDGKTSAVIEHGVHSIVGDGNVRMVCKTNGDLDVMRDNAVVLHRRCPLTKSPAAMAVVHDDYVALTSDGTLTTARHGRQLELHTDILGEYELALSSQGVIAIADYSGSSKTWFIRPDGTGLEPGPVHGSQPYSVATDGNLAAWGYTDGTVIALDATTGMVWKLRGHPDAVAYVVIDAANARVVSASGRELRVWELKPPASTLVTSMPSASFHLQLSPEGTRAALDCRDGSVWAWSRDTGAITQIHKHVGFSYGVQWVKGMICSGGWGDGHVRCSTPDGAYTQTLDSGTSRITWLTAAPDHESLIFASDDSKIWRFDGGLQELYSDNGVPHRMAISSDGRLLASCALDGSFVVFDLLYRRRVSQLIGHTGATCSVTWVDDELWATGGDGTLKRWGLRDGTLTLRHNVQASATTLRLMKVAHGGWAVDGGEGVLLVSLDGSSVALRLDLGRNIDTLDVSPDLRYVAAGVNGEIVVVDMQRNAIATSAIGSPMAQQMSFLDPTSLAFSEPAALKILRVDHLDYVPFQAAPEPPSKATF